MLMRGTEIMIVPPVIVDSAVAACPAPMLATSRSASSWMALRDLMSSIEAPLEEAADVEDESGRAIAEDRHAAEQRATPARRVAAYGVELLDNDLLLARELVHHQAGPS